MAVLTVNEFEFLRKLISIESTGGDPLPGKPYGEGPYQALEFFLGKAEECGMRTGILDGRVGWCEFGPESSSKIFGIICHLLGIRFGSSVSRRLKPELLGGIILLLIGIKILLSHLQS